MKLRKQTYYWVQIRDKTSGWVMATNQTGYWLESRTLSGAKEMKNRAEVFYQCKARIIKVTHREEVFKERVLQ